MKKKAKPINNKQIKNKIKAIIAEVLEIDEKKISPEARFVEDLGMDSMMALEILAAVEKIYKIEIPEESLSKIVNFNEVLKLTNKLLSDKNGHK